MLRDFANKVYGARASAGATPTRDARRRSDGAIADAASARPTRDDDDDAAPRTFADRWMMSWTDEDVTFLGEDPYGDCAGNIFAQAAVESRRGRASVDETREPRASASDGESRRGSMDDERGAMASAEEKARAFFRIGPT